MLKEYSQDILDTFETLNLPGKLFCIDFFNTISLIELEKFIERGYELNYKLDLLKLGIDFCDLQQLVDNHINYIKKEEIIFSLLVDDYRTIKREFYNPQDNFIVSVTIHHKSLIYMMLLHSVLIQKLTFLKM